MKRIIAVLLLLVAQVGRAEGYRMPLTPGERMVADVGGTVGVMSGIAAIGFAVCSYQIDRKAARVRTVYPTPVLQPSGQFLYQADPGQIAFRDHLKQRANSADLIALGFFLLATVGITANISIRF